MNAIHGFFDNLEQYEHTFSCKKHGTITRYSFSENAKLSSCPLCQEEDDEKELRIAHIKSLGLYEEHYGATLDNFQAQTRESEKYIKQICEFTRNPSGHCILLYGSSGTGKTHILSALTKHLGGQYITYEWLSMQIRASYSPKAKETEEDIMRRLCTLNFLAVDEIDKGAETDAKRNLLSFIARERHERHKPVAFAGNCDWFVIKSLFDGSVINRWVQSGSSFNFSWESFRKRGA